MPKAFITGVGGAILSANETAFVRAEQPAGLILFSRNCESAVQVRRLVEAFKEAAGTDSLLVLVDQEGGRVQRLRPPLASNLPAAASYLTYTRGDVVAAAALVRLAARLAAHELKSLGIDTSCAPVLDLFQPGAHDIIGTRAYADDPATVIALAGVAADGLMAGGVLPVMKHIPGHGRATSDSHLELPVVECPLPDLMAWDVQPFRVLAHLPAAMTAHIVYTAVDATAPASTSASVTGELIRGYAGFDGLLMSDDLSMKALSGPMEQRTEAVLAAGSDVALHCNGDLVEMRSVASAAPRLAGRSLARFERALAVARRDATPFDWAAARSAVARVLSAVA